MYCNSNEVSKQSPENASYLPELPGCQSLLCANLVQITWHPKAPSYHECACLMCYYSSWQQWTRLDERRIELEVFKGLKQWAVRFGGSDNEFFQHSTGPPSYTCPVTWWPSAWICLFHLLCWHSSPVFNQPIF